MWRRLWRHVRSAIAAPLAAPLAAWGSDRLARGTYLDQPQSEQRPLLASPIRQGVKTVEYCCRDWIFLKDKILIVCDKISCIAWVMASMRMLLLLKHRACGPYVYIYSFIISFIIMLISGRWTAGIIIIHYWYFYRITISEWCTVYKFIYESSQSYNSPGRPFSAAKHISLLSHRQQLVAFGSLSW